MEPGQEAMKVVARSNFREMLMCKPGELRWWTFADKLEDRMSLVDATIAQRGTKWDEHPDDREFITKALGDPRLTV